MAVVQLEHLFVGETWKQAARIAPERRRGAGGEQRRDAGRFAFAFDHTRADGQARNQRLGALQKVLDDGRDPLGDRATFDEIEQRFEVHLWGRAAG